MASQISYIPFFYSQLPLDVWWDILDWLSRYKLAKKLDQLLYDRQFVSIVQYWLHEQNTGIKMGQLSFNYYENEGGFQMNAQRLKCVEWKYMDEKERKGMCLNLCYNN